MVRELEHIDVSDIPELRRLAEEVQRSGQPRVLRRDRQDLAIVLPLTARTAAGRREQLIEAEIWADAGVADPADPWADYDPTAAQAALDQARGVLLGADCDELLGDIHAARSQPASDIAWPGAPW